VSRQAIQVAPRHGVKKNGPVRLKKAFLIVLSFALGSWIASHVSIYKNPLLPKVQLGGCPLVVLTAFVGMRPGIKYLSAPERLLKATVFDQARTYTR